MENKWWAYLHINGTIQVKRLFDDRQIPEALESPFVQTTVILAADNHVDAVKEADHHFK